jgi:2-aminobenzoate-CoA ligase
MQLTPSAHVDTFCRDNLPPEDQWPELRFDLPGLQYADRLNCAVELLDRVAERHGADRPCLHAPGQESWSYADLVRRSNQVARVLTEELGLVPGNRVLLRGPNNPWLAACWFGALKAGGVVVSTMPLLRPGELRTIDEIAPIYIALCDSRFTD